MPKTKKWSALTATYISPERQARNAQAASEVIHSLRELRKARALTQEQLSHMLMMGQGDISKLERRADVYISTLRRYIEAMGGELLLVARFPDGAEIPVELAETSDDGATHLAPT